ncbi:S9 family peptidase [Rivularia sp. UHCC 0363]|uniref:S9 family peptidase n=1 Tax=Rivularia sp. UHCC 0363 TaxID=3110244 RepID=UPI002B1F8022|nr:S9 family peptidase [Rivularia sp. UHCC 0363]MEA5593019.1 S9 family peptidase [Rivularia sp. UHCC 0363]
MTSQIAPYGSWKSPITTDLITSTTIGLGQIAVDGDNIYWSELRAWDKGRTVVVRRNPDGETTVTPDGFNVRSRVHEYGGGSYFVADGVVYFSNFIDQRLYQQKHGSNSQPITPELSMRYGDGIVDRQRQRIICVCEDHTQQGKEPTNQIVAINLTENSNPQVLVSSNDFYVSPRLSEDGKYLAWLTWNHPNMPWDSAELWVGTVQADGAIADMQKIAGGVDESASQPEWSSDGTLYFIWEKTGWWNLYCWRQGKVENLTPMSAEFGKPQWGLGSSTYAIESTSRIICSYTQKGIWYLASLDLDTKKLDTFDLPYTEFSGIKATPGKVLFNGGQPTQASELVQLDLTTKKIQVLQRSSNIAIDDGYLSQVQPIEFPTSNEKTAYGLFYPPQNKDYTAPPDQKPPLLVKSHGGPTAATSSSLSYGIQYWTSRGIAVLDVNYGGSTGYGREYRQRLDGNWGIVDVDDCANGAKYLVEQNLVDGDRLAISGGSAGGYTTLCALTFRDTFKAGASYYGVSDLEALARDTHKFESRYLDRLVGAYPEMKEIYVQRSPINFAENLTCPVIFLQGLEDKVVPPNQAESMIDILRNKGLPVAYVPFPGEQHGFRNAENIKRALEAELYFYSRVFGFDVVEEIQTVTIENL